MNLHRTPEALSDWDKRPLYIPREVMPQIDEADLALLLDFAKERRIVTRSLVLPAYALRSRQHIEFDQLRRVEEEALKKPALVSLDFYIFDGNYRWATHAIRGSDVPVIQFGVTFDPGLDFLFEFPKTYSYGDGDVHTVHN